MSLKGRRILVCGATGGIGRACAEHISQAGGFLYLTSRSVEKLDSWSLLQESSGHSAFQVDLVDNDSITSLVDSLPSIDGLVYAAGIIHPHPIKYITQKHIDQIFRINYYAAVLLVSRLLRMKKIKKGASIVFISSISSQFAHKGGALYAGSKAALDLFSKTLALECAGQQIRSNVISAAMVKTAIFTQTENAITAEKMIEHEKQYPLGFGDPQDIANSCRFLLSDESRWITGTEIVMDGGLTAGH